MRKIIYFAILMFSISEICSQDSNPIEKLNFVSDSLRNANANLQNEKNRLQNTIDSLQNHLVLVEKDYHDKEIKLQGNIKKLKDSNEAEVSNLNEKILRFGQVIDNLNALIKKCDKNYINSIEKIIEEKNDSINRLEETVSDLKKEILKERKNYEEKKIEKFVEGKQSVYDQIANSYQVKEFDNLINYTTPQAIERDFELIGSNEVAKKIIQDLKIYFEASLVLEKQYNEENIKNVQNRVSSIIQSGLVKNLNERLKDYHLYVKALKSSINRIMALDKSFIANNEDIEKEKYRDILNELSWYFYNYRNFTDYPYLWDIVNEIMDRKYKDADKDISDLLLKI